jgi:hypothetical protein
MRWLILATLLLCSCQVQPETPHLSDGEPECRVLSRCQAIWSDGTEKKGAVCKCIAAYKYWNVDCQQGFQKLTVCLYEHGCDLLDCYWGLSDNQINYCEYTF